MQTSLIRHCPASAARPLILFAALAIACTPSTPEPSIKNLLFATSEDVANAQQSNLTFDAGPESVSVSFQYANVPPDLSMHMELRRDNLLILDRVEAWDRGISGTAVVLLADDPHLLAPGTYDVEITLARQTLQGRFLISATKGEPGARLIADSFGDNLLNWAEFSDEESAAEIRDGRLEVSMYLEGSYQWTDLQPDFEDFDLSVDARQAEGPDDGYYAVVFRANDDSNYLFSVSVDGFLDVGLSIGDEFKELISPRWSGAIRRGGEVNRLRVVAQGSHFAFYINGELVATLTDDTLQRGGIGLASGNYSRAGMVSAFDNLVVTLPLEAVAVIPTPVVTAAPHATVAPTTPPTPPLLDTMQQTLDHVRSMGGSLDRIYNRLEAEACAPFLVAFYNVINAPSYDVVRQPNDIQVAYSLYREAVALVADQVAIIREECETGDGLVEQRAFGRARTAINEAGSHLETAIRLLTGQPN